MTRAIPSAILEAVHRTSSSLDTPETYLDDYNLAGQPQRTSVLCEPPIHLNTPEPLSQCFRHSGWKPMRRRVWYSLLRTDQSHWRRKAFRDCGDYVRVLRSVHDPSSYKLAGNYCHDRLCTPCATARSKVIGANALDLTRNKDVRFLTLTLKACSKSLAVRLDDLIASFSRLRETTTWRQHVKGGVYFIEIKYSYEHRSWHVHVHALIEGSWVAQKDLSNAWLTATGDSDVVDIRRPQSVNDVAKYVTKYASKPLDPEFARDQSLLDEAVLALKGRRLCTTFGTWRGVALARPPDTGEWHDVGTFDEFLDRVLDGDPGAVSALQSAGVRDVQFWATLRRPNHERPPPPPRPKPHQLILFDDDANVYPGWSTHWEPPPRRTCRSCKGKPS